MKRDLINKVLLAVVSVLLLLNLMVSFLRTPSTAYAAKTVQYKMDFSTKASEELLSKYGKEGWELVWVFPGGQLVFKK